jgi:UDP-N-acetylmuramoyl-tripeptide--D-alanyl-D-alanine ligase
MQARKLHQYLTECNLIICTDTRNIIKDSLFFALKGDNFNGNEFALKALESGAKYVVIDEEEYNTDPRCLKVKNALKALQYLAQYHRRQFDIPVIGITGSNGKTTTKELIAAVLGKKYNALVTEGNLNNHLGVPFTLLKIRKEHEIAVIEMGANKMGDIAELAEFAEPNYGIITNVGKAHLEGFGSFENVIKTKCEMYDAIEYANGTVFINSDDKTLLKNAPAINLYTYGKTGQIKTELVGLDPYLSFKWSAGHFHSEEVKTNLVGSYNLSNFAAAVAIGYYFEVDENDISAALNEYIPTNNRSQVSKINSNTLIVDCYNANVTSMNAALENFKEINATNKIAILGDMKELGEVSLEEHQIVVDWLTSNKVNATIVGPEFGKTKHSLIHFNSVEEMIDANKEKFTNSFVLLKGSRGIKLEKLIEAELF